MTPELNPFRVWDSLNESLKRVPEHDIEGRSLVYKRLENERQVLLSCGFNPVDRTYCAECY